MPSQNGKKASRAFFNCLLGYIILSTIIIYYVSIQSMKPPAPNKELPVWFYFAMGIGSIYVFVAFYAFYENYLQPYIKDLEKITATQLDQEPSPSQPVVLSSKGLYFWTFEWFTPALCVQFLVVVFFWMTASNLPFQQSLYTHPFMYGQVYVKMNNYISPEILGAGFSKKIADTELSKEQEMLLKRAQFLEAEFSGHLNEDENKKLDNLNYNKEYISAVEGMVARIYKIPFYIALTFAFLGTLMYSLNDIVCRFFISDLYPKTFISYIIRFLFAPAICMVLAFFFMNNWPINGAPILFFLVGFFPQKAMQAIEEKARAQLKLKRTEKMDIPLGLIQGMTDYNIYRLKELGVDDAQNLAYADVNYLRKNWYNDRQLGDFISQAMLLIHLKEDFSKLQNNGIRNIIAFKHVLKDKECTPEECEKFSQSVGVDKEKLHNLYNLINMSPIQDRIKALEAVMNKFDEKERQKLASSR